MTFTVAWSSSGIDASGRLSEGEIDAAGIWTGEPQRDGHLRSADFLDVGHHPKIMFIGRFTGRTGSTTFKGEVDLTIRGVTRTVPLDIVSLGQRKTPFWVGDENKGDLLRIGFEGTANINRHDFGVSWQDEIPGGGVVVGDQIGLKLDVEAILLDDLERSGAIEYYNA
jgi:polyisoprenoid-binding protein YceI